MVAVRVSCRLLQSGARVRGCKKRLGGLAWKKGEREGGQEKSRTRKTRKPYVPKCVPESQWVALLVAV